MSSLFSLLKSILLVGGLIKDLLEYFKDYQLRKIEKQIEVKDSASRRLNVKIKEEAAKEKPNEEAIKDLHRRLNRISNEL